MGEIIRVRDWAATPLGHRHPWSPSLKMMVSFLLANRFPLLLWWGPKYLQGCLLSRPSFSRATLKPHCVVVPLCSSTAALYFPPPAVRSFRAERSYSRSSAGGPRHRPVDCETPDRDAWGRGDGAQPGPRTRLDIRVPVATNSAAVGEGRSTPPSRHRRDGSSSSTTTRTRPTPSQLCSLTAVTKHRWP